MKDLLNNLIFVISICFIWMVLYFSINQEQIVFIYHRYPENSILSPKIDLLFFPIAFSLVMLYNYLLTLIGIKKEFILKVNFFIFLLNLIIFINIFYLNY